MISISFYTQIGQETTLSQLSFTLYEVLNNPRIEERYVALNTAVCSQGNQLILFPENLNVSHSSAPGNIEIRGKQN